MIEWIIGLIAFGVFVYFGPYKNVQKIQELQKQGLNKLDTIIDLLDDEKLITAKGLNRLDTIIDLLDKKEKK